MCIECDREDQVIPVGAKVRVKTDREKQTFTVVHLHPELRRAEYDKEIYYTDREGNVFATPAEELEVLEQRTGEHTV